MNTKQKLRLAKTSGIEEFSSVQNGANQIATDGILVVAGYAATHVFALVVDVDRLSVEAIYSIPASKSNNTASQISMAVRWISGAASIKAAQMVCEKRGTQSGGSIVYVPRFVERMGEIEIISMDYVRQSLGDHLGRDSFRWAHRHGGMALESGAN